MKKFYGMLFVLLLIPTMLVAVQAADDYPDRYRNAERDSVMDEWKFYNRECTSFVAWCLNSRNGIDFTCFYDGVRWGNASNWADAAREAGIPVDGNPAVGSVAWWNCGDHSLVAWVAAVNGDQVTVEEYSNRDRENPGTYHSRAVSAAEVNGFIHFENDKESGTMESSTPAENNGDKSAWIDGQVDEMSSTPAGNNGDKSVNIPEETGETSHGTVPTGDDYPANLKNAEMDSLVDSWGFYNRECTSFVAWCLNSRNGVPFQNFQGDVRWGNASNWADAARTLGITVDGTPAVGSVAWVSNENYSLVSWVAAVDGDKVTVEEYSNRDEENRGTYHQRKIPISSVTGFIHIGDIPAGDGAVG